MGWPARAIGCLMATALLAAQLPPAPAGARRLGDPLGLLRHLIPTSSATLRAQVDQLTQLRPGISP